MLVGGHTAEGAAAAEGAALPQPLGELPAEVWLLAAPACGEGGEGGEGGEARMLAACEGSPLLERRWGGSARGGEAGKGGEGGEGGEGGDEDEADEAAQALASLCVFEVPTYYLLVASCYSLLTIHYSLLTTYYASASYRHLASPSAPLPCGGCSSSAACSARRAAWSSGARRASWAATS